MIIRYLDPLERLEFEVIQRREEGSPFQDLDNAFHGLQDNDEKRAAAFSLLSSLTEKGTPPSAAEPDGLDAIKQAGKSYNGNPHALSKDILYDKILGGWLGRASGCLLGKPVERYMRPALKEMLQSNDNWPLDNYWTQDGVPQDILARYPWKLRGGLASLRENIECMPEDDDLNYPMLNLHVLEAHGFSFNSSDIGKAWLTNMPVFQTFTAERVAYFNLLNGLDAPYSGTYMNPFREWIGAQIRADLWGYVCPGNPVRAAELAWRDARVSHSRNGIYGEMFFAALIANAFIEPDLRTVIEGALTQIPQGSRLAKAICSVLEWPIQSMTWEAVLDRLEDSFGQYHWVHTINNASLVVAALLAGNGDFELTICNTVMGGWDTDSSGATAGSIIGVILGAKALPNKWIQPLNNRIRSSLANFDNASFTELAERTLTVSLADEDKKYTGPAGQTDDF